MKVGDLVKFKTPENTDEALERFMVSELRDDRVLVSLIGSHFRIIPTFVYLSSDLEVVN